MNQASDQLYIAIKNSEKLLETFFAGLHRIARLTQGFKPRSVNGKDVFLWEVDQPAPWCTHLPGTNVYINFTNHYIDQVFNELETLGLDKDEIEYVHKKANRSDVLVELVNEFWEDMKVYANTHATYKSNWNAPQ